MGNNLILFAANGFVYDSENDIWNYAMYLYGLNNFGENYYNENRELFKAILLYDKEFDLFNSVVLTINGDKYLMIFSNAKFGIIDIEAVYLTLKKTNI